MYVFFWWCNCTFYSSLASGCVLNHSSLRFWFTYGWDSMNLLWDCGFPSVEEEGKSQVMNVLKRLSCCPFMSFESFELPSNNQTWLAGKSPMNGGFIGKSPTHCPFSIAMFYYQRVHYMSNRNSAKLSFGRYPSKKQLDGRTACARIPHQSIRTPWSSTAHGKSNEFMASSNWFSL